MTVVSVWVPGRDLSPAFDIFTFPQAFDLMSIHQTVLNAELRAHFGLICLLISERDSLLIFFGLLLRSNAAAWRTSFWLFARSTVCDALIG